MQEQIPIADVYARLGTLDERTIELQKTMTNINGRLDLIAQLAPTVESMKKEINENIRPAVLDYESKKKYAIGGIGVIAFIWGGLLEGVKGAAKAMGIGQ